MIAYMIAYMNSPIIMIHPNKRKTVQRLKRYYISCDITTSHTHKQHHGIRPSSVARMMQSGFNMKVDQLH